MSADAHGFLPGTTLRRQSEDRRRAADDLRWRKPGCDALSKTCDALPTGCDGVPTSCDGVPTSCDGLPATCDGLPTTCDGQNPHFLSKKPVYDEFLGMTAGKKRQFKPVCRIASVPPARKKSNPPARTALGTDQIAAAANKTGKKSWRHGLGKAVGLRQNENNSKGI